MTGPGKDTTAPTNPISLKIVRRMFGRLSGPEEALRRARNTMRLRRGGALYRTNLYVGNVTAKRRVGIYGFGGCDLSFLAGAGNLLQPSLDASLAIHRDSAVEGARSDFVLQGLAGVGGPLLDEVVAKLELDPDSFTSSLFDERFPIPDHTKLGTYPKDIVVLSVAADLSRTLYQHRGDGLLVDPGGWWLNADLSNVLGDLDRVRWFSSTFKKLGKIPLDTYLDNLGLIVKELRDRTGATVVVCNTLVVDPGSAAIDYQFANSPATVRRRQFAIGLREAANDLGFVVMDVDRVTKGAGIAGQADFVHYTADQKQALRREFVRLVREHTPLLGG